MSIEVRGVTKSLGGVDVLKDVCLRIASGELIALLGPSGVGKTTLLRVIAGLEAPDRGAVLFHGEDAAAKGARQRGVGFVFQHYALFRHMTIFENVAFGLRVKPRAVRPPSREIAERVAKLLGLVQLDRLADAYPAQLSGGQRQRVALARALAVEPQVLLLDEPFGSLDARVRQELRLWLRRLHDELRVTTVIVTHDQEEALEVADCVVVMNEGRIEQTGPPEEVYERPASPFVCRFLGGVNVFHGRVDRGLMRIGDAAYEAPDHALARDRAASVYARPHEIEVSGSPAEGFGSAGIVRRIHAAGPAVRLEVEPREGGARVLVDCSTQRHRELLLEVGAPVYLRLKSLKIFLLDAPAG